jgi:hypothetical protein
MAQNLYDNAAFYAGYSQCPRSREGLAGTAEWPAFHVVRPGAAEKPGSAELSRWLSEADARSPLGTDLSERLLARAPSETSVATMPYALRSADFELGAITEWKPSEDQLTVRREGRETELRRPMFLLVLAARREVRAS